MIDVASIPSFGLAGRKRQGGRPKKVRLCDCNEPATRRLWSTDQMCCDKCYAIEQKQIQENKANGSGSVREKQADRRAAQAEEGIGWSDLAILKAALHAWELRHGIESDADIFD